MKKEKCISDAMLCQVKAELALDHAIDKLEKNPERASELIGEIAILKQNLEILRREVILEKVADQLFLADPNKSCEVTIKLDWEIEKLLRKADKIIEAN